MAILLSKITKQNNWRRESPCGDAWGSLLWTVSVLCAFFMEVALWIIKKENQKD